MTISPGSAYTSGLIKAHLAHIFHRRLCMKTSTRSGIRTALLCMVLIALFAGLGAYPTSALLQSQRNVAAPNGYIQGVVQSEKGPEAGVWVIAETKDTLTNFIKIVVTDDAGKFLVPDLPTNANY